MFGIGEGAKDVNMGARHRAFRRSASDRAGIIFPVTRIRGFLKAGVSARRSPVSRISGESAVCMAAMIEYMVAEVLEQAIEQTVKANRKIITPRFINLGIRQDPELGLLLRNVTIAGGGVLPYVPPEFLAKKPRTTRTRKRK